MSRGVLDRNGRPIRPLYWFHHTPEMCDASLAKGDWRSGRTECKRKAMVRLQTTSSHKYHICGHHAGMVRRREYVYVSGFGTVRPEDLETQHEQRSLRDGNDSPGQ